MKKLISAMSVVLAFVLVLSLSVFAAGESQAPSGEVSAEAVAVTNEGFGSYVAYLRSYMEAYSDPKLDDAGKQMALGELDTVDVGSDVYSFPFDMFVNEFAAMTYDEFIASQSASGEASAGASGDPFEVTNENFGSYVSYLRKYMEAYSDPKLDDAGKQMALGELDSVDVGTNVYGFPFEMFVNEFGAMTFDQFILARNSAASVEPETEEDFNAYVQYVRDYMTGYNGEGAKEGFNEDAKQMALGELDNVAFGSSVNGFPFEMFVNEFGVATYEEFLAAK